MLNILELLFYVYLSETRWMLGVVWGWGIPNHFYYLTNHQKPDAYIGGLGGIPYHFYTDQTFFLVGPNNNNNKNSNNIYSITLAAVQK